MITLEDFVKACPVSLTHSYTHAILSPFCTVRCTGATESLVYMYIYIYIYIYIYRERERERERERDRIIRVLQGVAEKKETNGDGV